MHYDVQQLLQFACITVFIILAKFMRHLRQPLVLGQLLAGVVLAIFAHYNIDFFVSMTRSEIIKFLAELGSIFLLFEIGLESNFTEILRAGKPATMVALTGLISPFVLGYFIVTPLIIHITNLPEPLPEFSSTLKLFIGAILAVTSTGISISIFKELKLLKSKTCQIILAASIIDDILGLTLLSIVTNIAVSHTLDIIGIGITILIILTFFVVTILFGKFILPEIINLIALISNNIDTLVLIMISYALSMAFIASSIGLASIIGAFLAGLILESSFFNKYRYPRYLRTTETDRFINKINPINILEHMIKPFGMLLTPIFFIYAGMQMDIIASANISTITIAIIFSIFAIISKLIAGIWLPKSSNRWIVGLGMVPRGEVGLIFAVVGLDLKIINQEIFAALVLMVIITSVLTPPLLTYALKKANLK